MTARRTPARCEWPDGRDEHKEVHVAEGFRDRLIGLTGHRLADLPEGHAMLFERCPSVHTCFMRGPVDVVWLASGERDGAARVVAVDSSVPPWRFLAAPRGADAAMEAAAGAFDELDPPELIRLEEKGAEGHGDR